MYIKIVLSVFYLNFLNKKKKTNYHSLWKKNYISNYLFLNYEYQAQRFIFYFTVASWDLKWWTLLLEVWSNSPGTIQFCYEIQMWSVVF